MLVLLFYGVDQYCESACLNECPEPDQDGKGGVYLGIWEFNYSAGGTGDCTEEQPNPPYFRGETLCECYYDIMS